MKPGWIKKRFLSFILSLFVLLGLLAGTVYLSLTAPFHPGHILYGWQNAAEQAQLALTAVPEQQAALVLTLADRRLASLAQAQTATATQEAVTALSDALATAVTHLNNVPAANQEFYTAQFQALLRRTEIVLTALEPDEGGPLTALTNRVRAWQALDSLAEMAAQLPAQADVPRLNRAALVPFLMNNVDHSAYPLTAGHADVPCASCHPDGQYTNTSTQCADCHSLPPEAVTANLLSAESKTLWQVYPNHFAGSCDSCHTTHSWQLYQFDHIGVTECTSCHAGDLPLPVLPEIVFINASATAVSPTHYPGDCLLCHTDTTSWALPNYEHDTSTACETCHSPGTPILHYPGFCSECHADTEEWTQIDYRHEGVTGCEICHSQDTPEPHLPGTCTLCHADVEKWTVIEVNHAGLSPNCLTCHQAETPQPHYEGTCRSCHNTLSWSEVSFDHTFYQNCQACHTEDVPTDHYSGQCSSCHQETTWQDVAFDHTGQPDCGSCHLTTAWDQVWITHGGFTNCTDCHGTPGNHFPTTCTNCHNTDQWLPAHFSHNGLTDCRGCHAAQTPAGHMPGQCSTCHNTNRWPEIIFSHTGSYDCQACHAPPGGHWPGQCANCHNTNSWQTSTIDHTGLTDCAACHAAPGGHWLGQCVDCHNTTSWQEVSVDHSSLYDCATCHAPPGGHWPGQCSSCHSTTNWSDVTFDHTGYTDCKACHARPDDHGRGQCSRCHTTDSWQIVPTATAVPLPTSTSPPTSTPEP